MRFDSVFMIRFRNLMRSLGIISLIRRAQGSFNKAHKERLMKEFQPEVQKAVPIQGAPVPVLLRPLDAGHYAELMTAREPAVMKAVVEHVNPNDCVWDVGANIGYFTVIFAKCVGDQGKVFAFEPEPKTYQETCNNVQLNSLTNVEILPFGLSDQDSEAFLTPGATIQSGIHSLSTTEGNPEQSLRVKLFKGDHLVERGEADVPTVLKIDVEGTEELVIRGLNNTLRDPRCRVVICEIHFSILASRNQQDVPKVIRQTLEKAGFASFKWLDSSHLLAAKN